MWTLRANFALIYILSYSEAFEINIECSSEPTNIYPCYVRNLTMTDELTVTSAVGNHIGNLSNSNVTHLAFIRKTCSIASMFIGLGKILPNLVTLELQGIGLKFVKREHFSDFQKVEGLSLDFNQLESIPEDAFNDLHSLTLLSFQDNLIKELPEKLLVNLVNLRILIAGSNPIEVVPENFFDFNSKMYGIYFERSRVKSVKADFTKLANISCISFLRSPCNLHFSYMKVKVEEFQRELNEKCP